MLKENSKNKSHDISTYNSNYSIEKKNNILLKLKENKKKINLLSDDNISLLTEIKNLKYKIMDLKKDKQYLIEQITELNMTLNNKIKPKLNENEDSLMFLKNKIIELKNKNRKLIKENNLQKEIIKDLKNEISDIHQKTSILCKDSLHLRNYNTNIKNKKNNSGVKAYLSMRNLQKHHNNINYMININEKNDLDKDNIIRINTENNLFNDNPFFKNKNVLKNNYTRYNFKNNENNNISSLLDNIINLCKKEKNETKKYYKTSYDMKYSKRINKLIKKNKNLNLYENNKENYNYNEINKYSYKNNLNKYNENAQYFCAYSKSNGKIINKNKFEDEDGDIKCENLKINNISSFNKSLLSDYIEEYNIY